MIESYWPGGTGMLPARIPVSSGAVGVAGRVWSIGYTSSSEMRKWASAARTGSGSRCGRP